MADDAMSYNKDADFYSGIDKVPSAGPGGFDMLDGAIGILPLVDHHSSDVEDLVKRYRALDETDPGTDAALNFAALDTVAAIMRLAGSATTPGRFVPRPMRP